MKQQHYLALGYLIQVMDLKNWCYLKIMVIFWYFGESFINKVEQKSNIGQQELFNFTNTPFNVFGDMFILPYALLVMMIIIEQ
jgi:hypothetical protein